MLLPFLGFALLILAQSGCANQKAARVSSDPTSRPSAASAPSASPLPEVNRPESIAAYRYLLTKRTLVFGSACGFVGETTELWRALSQLVNAREHSLLRDLALRSYTVEARAAAVVGLVKLHDVSEVDAGTMLNDLHGSLTTCEGCIVRDGVRPAKAAAWIGAPLLGEDNLVTSGPSQDPSP